MIPGMTAEDFRAAHPDVYFLDPADLSGLSGYLRRLRVLGEEETIHAATKAGDGNMNVVVRARTDRRSLIVKQSRPWVERYPTIAAPWDRVLSESRFYQLASAHDAIAPRLPRLIEVDPEARVLVLEDLGEARDYSGAYRGARLPAADAGALAAWLAELHGAVFAERSRASLTNLPMRRLNHEHLFRFPLDPTNGIDLDAITPGLRGAADELVGDPAYVNRVGALGDVYLGAGASLLHGDFFPGSWLATDSGPRVIDPEFGFFGPGEFDVGVFLAHLYLAQQAEAVHSAVVDGYRPRGGFDWRRALRFCGVEIMRRLIGVAQLPIDYGLEEKRRLLSLSRSLVLAEEPLASDGLLAREALRDRDAESPPETRRA